MIYAQAIGAALMCFGHQRILKRYKGETSFGWAVAAYIPLALLLVGVGTWIEWADYEVSYPLGTAIVGSNRPSDVYGICNRTRRSTSVS